MYKYVITTSDDRKLYKADPYGNYAQLRPDNASIVTDLSGFKWTDSVWQTEKQTKDILKQPMAIYECHIGSWMKHPVSDPEKGNRILQLPRICRSFCRILQGYEIYTCRADGNFRASV